MNNSLDYSLDDNVFESFGTTSSQMGFDYRNANINSTINSVTEDNIYPYVNLTSCNYSFYDHHQSSCSSSTFDCDNILGEDGRISLAYENLKHIPKRIAEKFSKDTTFLDLSYNCFRSLSFLTYFKALHTLILDRNSTLDESTLPYLPKLKILWVNNCDIQSIPKWIFRIQTQCPNLEQLSMLGNPGAKSLINGASAYENKDYILFIQRTLTNLKYLDGVPIDHENRSSSSSFSVSQSRQSSREEIRSDSKNNSLSTKGSRGNIRSLFRFRKTKRNVYTTSSSS